MTSMDLTPGHATVDERAPVRTLVVDDVEDVREGLARLLRHMPGIEVVGTAVDGEDAIAQVARLAPTVVLMDMRMPRLDGLAATRQITASHPEVAVIVLSAYGDESLVVEALLCGARGYLLKGTEIVELAEAVTAAAAGQSRLSGAVTKPLLERLVDTLGTERALRQQAQDAQRELVASETEARALASRLSSLIAAAPVAVVETDLDGRVLHWNPTAERMYGWTEAEMLGRHDPHAELDQAVPESAPTGSRHQCSNGELIDVEVVVASVPGSDVHAPSRIRIALDVTERRHLETALHHQAFHDTLTGLPNRALFTERLRHALSRARHGVSHVAVLLLDLDGFKTVNDSLGHEAGDQVLVSVAETLKTQLRPQDTVARLGGDEFAVLIEVGPDQVEGEDISERMLTALRTPRPIDGRLLNIRASVGIAEAGEGYDGDDTTLLRDADIAMYVAKSQGKSRTARFEPAMRDALLERLRLEEELRAALDDEILELHYQPIIDLTTERLQSVEALVRWPHPTRGYIPPLAFIEVAEEIGLMPALGEWVLRNACAQLVAWTEDGTAPALSVSVNVSPLQFVGGGFPELVATVLAETGLPPERLVLEITEGVLVTTTDALDALKQLKALGVRVAIDDFGTGYSSLSYLRTLDVDVLKIDKTFIDHISREPDAAALVESIIGMAASLRLHTVAEGVTDDAQLAVLRRSGCESGQGYLFARPLTAQTVTAMLHDDSEPHEGDGVEDERAS